MNVTTDLSMKERKTKQKKLKYNSLMSLSCKKKLVGVMREYDELLAYNRNNYNCREGGWSIIHSCVLQNSWSGFLFFFFFYRFFFFSSTRGKQKQKLRKYTRLQIIKLNLR